MKSVWSDETSRIINKINKISCCVLLTNFHLKIEEEDDEELEDG